MNALPDALFIIDVGYQKIAVTEANKLSIPIIGVVDTNHSPEGIAYVIPGNDDSSRAIRLYARGVADAILEGQQPGDPGNRPDRGIRRDFRRRGTDLKRSEGGARPLFLGITPARMGNLRVDDQKDVERTSMAEVTASMVMELRGRTGLGMMECKKALLETGGDMAKAEDLLRIKSGAKASKAADRVAAEGVIGATIAADGKTGAMRRAQLRDRFRRAQRGFRRVRGEARAARRRKESGRRRGAARAAAGRRHGRIGAAGAGAEARREHLDPPLLPRRDAGAADAIPARRPHRRDGRRSRAATSRPARTSRCISPRVSPTCVRCAFRATRFRPS